jgi:hypothetical protein
MAHGHVEKRILDPSRVRRTQHGFSWIDRRFVRDGWIEGLERDAILLYLFLVAVADKDGLSYYSDPRTSGILKVSLEELARARARLVQRGLVAYCPPLYQVLEMAPLSTPREQRRGGSASLAEILLRVAAPRERGEGQ